MKYRNSFVLIYIIKQSNLRAKFVIAQTPNVIIFIFPFSDKYCAHILTVEEDCLGSISILQ